MVGLPAQPRVARQAGFPKQPPDRRHRDRLLGESAVSDERAARSPGPRRSGAPVERRARARAGRTSDRVHDHDRSAVRAAAPRSLHCGRRSTSARSSRRRTACLRDVRGADSFDETPRQLIGEDRVPVRAEPGRRARSITSTCVTAPPTSSCLSTSTDPGATRRSPTGDLAECMRDLVDEHYPDAERTRVVLDNVSSHSQRRCTSASRLQKPAVS